MGFEVPSNGTVEHFPPDHMTTRMVYVYRGICGIGQEKVRAGNLAILEGEGALKIAAGADGCGFLFIAGKPLGEAIVSHGPFVMSSREQIKQCFEDYQRGKLCPKPLTLNHYT